MKVSPGDKHPVEERVLRFISRHELGKNGTSLVVAVSGGQDSVCLLQMLVKLRAELGVDLHVAHLDHQLRGADSRKDARYVSNLARRLGVPATIERRDVREYHARRRASLEETAREVRYAFLAEVVRSVGADGVVVGHTLDDHAETVLMHLIRGTGITGLRGLQPLSRWQTAASSLNIIRPLLEVSRKETDAYCRYHRLRPRIDASNYSLSPLRNRIRHHLLPLLSDYNPRIVAALIRLAQLAGDDLALLDDLSSQSWQETVRQQSGTFVLDKDGFLGLPVGLQRNLLRRAMGEMLGSLKDVEARHIEEILDSLNLPPGSCVSLPGGLLFSVDYDRYLLGDDRSGLCPFPELTGEYLLKIPGETLVSGWRVEAEFITPEEMTKEHDDFTAFFRWDEVEEPVTVRARRHGDRFQPLGLSVTKKVGEFMIDALVPRPWRERVPLVCLLEHIIWVVGWRVDDRMKVTADNRQVLRLRFKVGQ